VRGKIENVYFMLESVIHKQFSCRLDPFTIVADYIVPVLNTPMLTYTDSSAFMLMAKELEMMERVFKTHEGDGVIADGGSMGNQIPIALAKYRLLNEAFKQHGMSGLGGRKLIVFTSEDVHYSTKQGSILQGKCLGTFNIFPDHVGVQLSFKNVTY